DPFQTGVAKRIRIRRRTSPAGSSSLSDPQFLRSHSVGKEGKNYENRTPSQRTEQTYSRWTRSGLYSCRLLNLICGPVSATSSVGESLFLYHGISRWENRDAITSCQPRTGSDGDSRRLHS